jgi:hypothetical protein
MAEIDPEDLKRLLAPSRHTDLALAEAIDATHPDTSHIIPEVGAAPTLETAAVSAPATLGGSTRLPVLSHQAQRGLPMISPGTPAGSSADYENQLERLRAPREPITATGAKGVLQHIGRGLEKVGNIAGDVFAPATMTLIPGTDLNKRAQIHEIEPKLERAKEQEELTAERKGAAGRAERKESSEEEERAARTKNLNEKDSAALAEHGLVRDAEGNVKPDPTSPIYQKNQLAMQTVANVQRYRAAQQELIEAKTEVERAKNDPDSPAFKAAQQRLAMAAEAHRIAGQNLALHQQEFSNKLSEQEFVKPSGQAASRASAARSVIDLYDAPGKPGLESLVRKNAKSMGPLMGRLEKGEIALGDVDPAVAELYGAMKSFYALQPAVHGFKNAEFVKDFETALGTLERDPEAFIAGMKGLRPTLESVAKEGVTYHKRVKEGETNTPKTEEGGGGAKKKLPF